MTLHNLLQGQGLVHTLSWLDFKEGPENAPTWTAYVVLSGTQYGPGVGPTKQAARNLAAKKALDVLTTNSQVQTTYVFRYSAVSY